MFEVEQLKKIRRSRARVLRGSYQIEGDPDKKKPAVLEEPPGVAAGRIALFSKEGERGVSVRYNSEKYGVAVIETIEEMTSRYKSELEKAQEELEKEKEKAFQQGKKEGYDEGFAAGEAEVAETMAKLMKLVEAVNTATREYFAKVEDRLAEFAMMIARKVVGDVAESHREIAVGLAAEAVKLAIDKTKILLIVNPIDLENLKKARADLRSISEGIKDIEIESSVNVQPGGVILETVGGSIDATIETMLDEIHKALKPGYQQGVTNGEEA